MGTYQIDLARFWNSQNFRPDLFDIIAQLALAEAVSSECVDVAEDVAEVIVEERTPDAIWKLALDIGDNIPDTRPRFRHDFTCGRIFEIDEDRRLAGRVDAFRVIETTELFEFFFDAVRNLIHRFVDRCTRPRCLNNHGFDGEIGIFGAAQIEVRQQSGDGRDDHEVPDQRTVLQSPVRKIELFHGAGTSSTFTDCPSVRL